MSKPTTSTFYGFATQGNITGNNNTATLNTANLWMAWGFLPDQSKTLSKVKMFCSAKTGSPGANDLVCEIFSDGGMKPGITTSTSSNTLSSAIAAGSFAEWTGFTYSITAGTPIWFVVKNANGTPASNNATFRQGGAFPVGTSPYSRFASTSNAGSTWALGSHNGGWRLEFDDGTYAGLPCSQGAAVSSVFGTQEYGNRFTTPAVAITSIGASFYSAVGVGSPGGMRFRLYQGTTLIATSSGSLTPSIMSAAQTWYTLFWSSPITLAPNTTYRLVMGDTASGDTSSNAFAVPTHTFENTAASLGLMPWQSGLASATTLSGGSWTDDATSIVPCGLLLDNGGEFGFTYSF